MVVDGLISVGIIEKSQKKSQNSLKNLNILDVGCGGGILTEALAYLHGNLVGLDAAEDLIVAAREHSKRLNAATANRIKYICDTIEEHADKNPSKYDVVIASEVVEHITDKESFLTGCAKALKVYTSTRVHTSDFHGFFLFFQPGGTIFVTTINKTVMSFIFYKLVGEYLLGVVPIGTHSWFKFVDPREIEKILNKSDCKKHELCGLKYNLLKSEWEFTSWTSFGYGLQMVKNR
jgi:polyprenyldihydroxybenzoate methyltransferase / 3-demethylubiquinol 3-O-methyltransferase